MAQARLTISEVHRRTGIPVTTLRFYERELPDFFTIEKTRGGHRRYTEETIQQFLLLKRMVETDGLRLSQIRDRLPSRPTRNELRKVVDLLLSVYEAMTEEMEKLRVRIESLEMTLGGRKVSSSTSAPTAPKKRRWF